MEKYDVIIVGGGLGGLACGVMLSKEGKKVCLLEQHSVIGGCLQSFKRGSYVLDTGMHYIGSMEQGQIMNQFLKYFGILNDLNMQKLDESGFDTFFFRNGSTYKHASGYERFGDTLERYFPNEKEGIRHLCQTIKDVGSLISTDILKGGSISKEGFRYMSMSAYDEIRSNVSNHDLRNLFAGSCTLFAGDKNRTSFYEYAMTMHSNIEGAYSFVDGSQQLAEALSKQILDNGGVVMCNARVSKIALNGHDIDYVEIDDGNRITAQDVISSLHPQNTLSLLHNNSVIKKSFFSRIRSLDNTYGLFSTYLLLKPDSIKYNPSNSYFFNTDDVWSLDGSWKNHNISTVLMCMQPNHNSKYTKVITLLTPMPARYYERWLDTGIGKRGREYYDFKEKYSDAVFDFVCQFMPHLKEAVLKIYNASPLTYRDYTSTPNGSAYGIVKDYNNPLLCLIPVKTKINHLFLTGQNINVHGCIGTTISALVTCSEILGKEYLTKKIANA